MQYQEIKKTLFNIGDSKSLGLDEFSSNFFKAAWKIVGEDLRAATKEFFLTSQLLKEINHTIIVFIPKSNHVQRVDYYKSIFYCNVVYKVITKILTRHITLVLEYTINAAQTTFIN